MYPNPVCNWIQTYIEFKKKVKENVLKINEFYSESNITME